MSLNRIRSIGLFALSWHIECNKKCCHTVTITLLCLCVLNRELVIYMTLCCFIHANETQLFLFVQHLLTSLKLMNFCVIKYVWLSCQNMYHKISGNIQSRMIQNSSFIILCDEICNNAWYISICVDLNVSRVSKQD